MSEIVNKVAASGLITLSLEDYLPDQDIIPFDLKDYLFKGLILREKDFRLQMKEIDWTIYRDKIVAVHCSADAIVPKWAYMLIGVCLEAETKAVYFGTVEEVTNELVIEAIRALKTDEFIDRRVVVKGCGEHDLSPAVYLAITQRLKPVVKSLMYGEPCSTVPLYKQKKK